MLNNSSAVSQAQFLGDGGLWSFNGSEGGSVLKTLRTPGLDVSEAPPILSIISL